MHEVKSYKDYTLLALTLILIGSSFFVGKYVGRTENPFLQPTSSNGLVGVRNINMAPFWDTWKILDEKFVPVVEGELPNDQEKLWGAIVGLAGSFNDPYTTFLPPEDSSYFESEISGNFEGVGMEIGVREKSLTVVAPLKGTPAEKAGVRAGDIIVEIDGRPSISMPVDEAIRNIRGEKGTTVNLVLFREGADEPIRVSIVRDVINIPTISTEEVSGGIFVIRLYNFSAVSPNLFRNALRDFLKSPSRKLILDLRGNPGGYLEAAIDMASWFLPAGKAVVIEDFGGNEENFIYRSKGYDIFKGNLKMVVLIDGGSASASEILAGALKEHGIATLVGENTFGKGSVQELIKITPETSLKVTIAHWLTPLENSISEGGLVPDVEVKITPEDVASKKDPQFEKAVEILRGM